MNLVKWVKLERLPKRRNWIRLFKANGSRAERRKGFLPGAHQSTWLIDTEAQIYRKYLWA